MIILTLIFGIAVVGFAQKSILTGSVYGANGAVIVGAKITATNVKGAKLETKTNNDGVYFLNLPFNHYDSVKLGTGFRIAKYEIIVEGLHFEKLYLNEFRLVPAFKGKMNLDFALDIAPDDNIEPSGCIPEFRLVNSPEIELSDKIITKPLEDLTKTQKQNNRKIDK